MEFLEIAEAEGVEEILTFDNMKSVCELEGICF